jgi:hypothetical protein
VARTSFTTGDGGGIGVRARQIPKIVCKLIGLAVVFNPQMKNLIDLAQPESFFWSGVAAMDREGRTAFVTATSQRSGLCRMDSVVGLARGFCSLNVGTSCRFLVANLAAH